MTVQRCVNDLNKVFFFARPVIHRGHVFPRSLRPLDDKRLPGPAAAGPVAAVGIAQAACGFCPRCCELFIAHLCRAVGRSRAVIVSAEGYYTLKLGVFLREVEVYHIIALVILDYLAVDHYVCFGNESYRLRSVDGVRLEVRQTDGNRRGLRRRRGRGSRGRDGALDRLAQTLIGLYAANDDKHQQHQKRGKYDRSDHGLCCYFLSLIHILIHPVCLFREMNVVVYMILAKAVITCAL